MGKSTDRKRMMDTITTTFLLALCLCVGCGGGGNSGAGETMDNAGAFEEPTLVTGPILSNVVVLAENAAQLYVTENEAHDTSVFWAEPVMGGVVAEIDLYTRQLDRVSGWQDKEKLIENSRYSTFAVKTDMANNVHLFWQTPGEGVYAKSRYNQFWQDTQLLEEGGACPDIATGQQSYRTAVVWCQSSRSLSFSEFLGAQGWSEPTRISKEEDAIGPTLGDTYGNAPVVAIDGNGVLTFAWSTTGANIKIVTTQYDETFSDPVTVYETGSFSTPDPEIFYSNDDKKLLVWNQLNGHSIDLMTSVHDGVNWRASETRLNSASSFHSIKANVNNNGTTFLYASTTGTGLTAELFYAFYNGVSWTEMSTIGETMNYGIGKIDEETNIVFYEEKNTTKARVIHSGSMTEPIDILDSRVEDINLVKLSDQEGMVVWRELLTVKAAQFSIPDDLFNRLE